MQRKEQPVIIYLADESAQAAGSDMIRVHSANQLVEALAVHPHGRVWMPAMAYDALEPALREQLCDRVELTTECCSAVASPHLLESLKRQIYKACESSLEGMLITDNRGRILMANAAAATILGEEPEQLFNHSLWQLCCDRIGATMYRHVQAEVESHGHWRGELYGIRHNGERFPIWLSVNLICNEYDDSVSYVINISDISKLRRSEEQLAYMAQHDSLTGLFNRCALDNHLGKAINWAEHHGRQLAVLFIDLDRFKPVNDMFGHAAGDQLLILVAQRLQTGVRRDDIIARIGGDEFAVLLQGMENLDTIAQIAEKLIHHLSMEYRLGDKPVNISASVGISLYPQDGITVGQLMQQADAAMYVAKRRLGSSHRRYAFYNRCQSEYTRARYLLEQDLRVALVRRQFQFVYQPIFELSDNRVVAIESLLRWQHPGRGQLVPAEFLSLAEESGLAMTLAELEINEVFSARRNWHNLGVELPPVTLNISLSQLQPELIELMHEALLIHQCYPNWFELEIQEDGLADRPMLFSLMAKLHQMGFSLSIDGVSLRLMELERVRDLPVKRLKIPRRLIQRCGGDDELSRAMISSVLLLGHSMKMNVTATGVETEEQVAYLRQVQCNEVQGRLMAAPLGPDALLDFLQDCHGPRARWA